LWRLCCGRIPEGAVAPSSRRAPRPAARESRRLVCVALRDIECRSGSGRNAPAPRPARAVLRDCRCGPRTVSPCQEIRRPGRLRCDLRYGRFCEGIAPQRVAQQWYRCVRNAGFRVGSQRPGEGPGRRSVPKSCSPPSWSSPA
jgi:hypothetical protein